MKTRLHFAKCLLSILVFSASSALAQTEAERLQLAGMKASDANDYTTAVTDYKKAVQLDPTLSTAQFRLGLAYIGLGQSQQAVAAFKKYLTLPDKPDEQSAWLFLGESYQTLKQYTNSADAYRTLIRLTTDPKLSYLAHYELGQALSLTSQDAAAVTELQKAVQLEPTACSAVGTCDESEDLRGYLGLALFGLNRYQEAANAYQQAIQIKPDDIDNYYYVGVIYARLGRRSDALAAYQKLRAAGNSHAAEVFTEIQKIPSGTAVANSGPTATKPAPKSQPTATQTASATAGQCQDQIDAETYAKAVDTCKLAVASAPFDASIWSNLGTAYFGSKRYDEAAQAYQQVTRINPKDARAQYGIGAAYVESRQFAKAVPYLREAVRLDANSANQWYDLGHSLYETGQYTSAAEALETAARLQPNDAATDYWLGETYVKLRSKAKAQAAYQRLVGPDRNNDQKLAQQLNAEISAL